MSSRAQVIHGKGVTAGGLGAKKLMVSPSSQEVVSRAKRRQGLKSPWALATEECRKKLGLTGMVLFNVGKDGKALYACVKKSVSK